MAKIKQLYARCVYKLQRVYSMLRYKVLVLRYEKFPAWLKKHKNSWFLLYLEHASWFRWYGKRVVYVKPKDSSTLTATEKDVKDAINAKDYQKALDIVENLPHNTRTIALKQVITAKLNV